ncbi:putative cleavage induced serine protease family S33, partial [Globisporangium polare]
MALKMLRPMATTAGVLLLLGFTTKGRFWEWVPASYQRLESVE